MTDQATSSIRPVTPPSPQNNQPSISPWRRGLRRMFGRLSVELSIGALIIVSVVLTMYQLTLEDSDPRLHALEMVNWGLTVIFIVELGLRFLAAGSKRRFFREFWLDIIAVMPWFRVFRAARAVRLLRLLRLLRLFGLVSRITTNFPYILRRGAIEYLMVCGLLLVTVVFGTGAILYFEGKPIQPATDAPPPAVTDHEAMQVEDAFWFSLYSLFAGEPIPQSPDTIGGRVVAVFIMFMGLTIFAMFTGTVTAFMVERLRTGGQTVDWDELNEHIIICGWNTKGEIILREYQSSHLKGIVTVVIAEFDGDIPELPAELQRNVRFLDDDFTRVAALEKAGVDRATSCIILSDNRMGRSQQDADARTILASLTVEKLNSDVYTCAELLNRSYGTHLERGHVNDYVVSGEHSGFLLSQAAINHGMTSVVTELLSHQHGSQFYRLSLPEHWVGKSFMELFVDLKQNHNAILLAVHCRDDDAIVNPAEYTFQDGDDIVVIAEQQLKFEQ